jgi:predicted tellurium resistance membrane protein TerC
MVEWLSYFINFLVLIVLEVVLGIDNIIFLAILSEQLPPEHRQAARRWGLAGALILRLVLLSFALVLVQLSSPFITISGLGLSPRDLFFILGGAFLIYKSLAEIASDLEFYESNQHQRKTKSSMQKQFHFYGVVVQIMLMDLIFSLDSVLTAVGLTNVFSIMAFAMLFAILVMLYASEPVSRFIHRHPSIKMLALSFLVMLGFFLGFEGFHHPIAREYLYFAMFFSFTVECLNLLYRHRKNGGEKK